MSGFEKVQRLYEGWFVAAARRPRESRPKPIETLRRQPHEPVRVAEARERRAGEILLKPLAGKPWKRKNPREQPVLRELILRRSARDACKGKSPEAAALRLSITASAVVSIRRQTACGFNAAETHRYLVSGESSEG